jgi:cobalt-zinc-cadmium efflux system outer membrane protein
MVRGKIDLIEVLGLKIELQKAYISETELLEKKAITILLILELTDNLIKNREN